MTIRLNCKNCGDGETSSSQLLRFDALVDGEWVNHAAVPCPGCDAVCVHQLSDAITGVLNSLEEKYNRPFDRPPAMAPELVAEVFGELPEGIQPTAWAARLWELEGVAHSWGTELADVVAANHPHRNH